MIRRGAFPMRAMLRTTTVCLVLAACATALADNQMPWQPDLETAKRVAAQTNRLVLIHFWAPWCRPCLRMEQDVFSKPETAKALEANFVLVKLNADDAPGTARLYGVSSLPSDVITLPNGRLVSQLQSPPTATQYVQMMNRAADGHRALARRQSTEVGAVEPPLAAPQPDAAPPAAAPQTPAAPVTTPPVANVAEATTPAAPPAGGNPYDDYFPAAQTANTAPSSAAATGAVTPAQAYAPPAAPVQSVTQAGPVDPYAHPAAPAADPYAVAPVAPQPAAAPQAAAPMNPYAAPPAADPYAMAGAPANPYAPPMAPPAAAPVGPPLTPAPQAPAPQTATALYQPQVNLPQLPPGCPPVALDGNCPVTLMERKRWSVGHASFGAVHRGRTYLFLGPQERDKFLADPDRFSPVMSGLDPVHALDHQQQVPGKREYGVFGADGKIYLFADEASRAKFEQNEQHYTAAANQTLGQPTYQAMRPTP
jgi:thiol-disulfide isomerase/thioredoxin/YHS domain-containing protein